jgi:hypothetical protein
MILNKRFPIKHINLFRDIANMVCSGARADWGFPYDSMDSGCNVPRQGGVWQHAAVRESLTTAIGEIDTLNRLVVIFLEQAELRVKERKQLTLDYWRDNVDRMLTFNEKPVLEGKGSMSHERMREIAHERFDAFDGNRRLLEAKQADAEELEELEKLEKKLQSDGGRNE